MYTGMSLLKTIYLGYVATISKGENPLKNLSEEKL
jgi:hypothetical protein